MKLLQYSKSIWLWFSCLSEPDVSSCGLSQQCDVLYCTSVFQFYTESMRCSVGVESSTCLSAHLDAATGKRCRSLAASLRWGNLHVRREPQVLTPNNITSVSAPDILLQRDKRDFAGHTRRSNTQASAVSYTNHTGYHGWGSTFAKLFTPKLFSQRSLGI